MKTALQIKALTTRLKKIPSIIYLGVSCLATELNAAEQNRPSNIQLPDAIKPVIRTAPPIRKKKKIKKKFENTGPSATEIRDKELLKLSAQPINTNYMMGLNLIIPTIRTKDNREKYKIEPTSMFYGYKKFHESADKKVGYLGGFRVAAFSGSGEYNGFIGQYGWLYFGPSLGIFYLDEEKKSVTKNKPEATEFIVNNIHFLHFGISLQTRRGTFSFNDAEVDDDLSTTQGVHFDTPGFWSEYQFQRVYFGGLGAGAIFGFQVGRGKVITWLGLSTSGWI